MMQKLSRVMIGGVFLTSLMAMAAENVAYINMSQVFQGYYKTRNSEGDLRRQEEEVKDQANNIARQVQAIRKRQDELETQALNVALSEEARDKSRSQADALNEQAQRKQQELREFVANKRKELQKQYVKMRNDIVKELLEFVQGYAKDNDIEMILDVSGMTNNMLPTVVYYPQKKEITETILKLINAGHEDELKGAEETPAAE
jgi:Skp family chaperone for outer membrane proteins